MAGLAPAIFVCTPGEERRATSAEGRRRRLGRASSRDPTTANSGSRWVSHALDPTYAPARAAVPFNPVSQMELTSGTNLPKQRWRQ